MIGIGRNFHHSRNKPHQQRTTNFSTDMKTKNETTAFDKLTLTAVTSYCCAMLYFLATNLLA